MREQAQALPGSLVGKQTAGIFYYRLVGTIAASVTVPKLVLQDIYMAFDVIFPGTAAMCSTIGGGDKAAHCCICL